MDRLCLLFGIAISVCCNCVFLIGFVEGQTAATFRNGTVDSKSLVSQNAQVDSSGTLTLDASKGSDAYAFHSTRMGLYDSATKSVLSFATFFTYSSNSTSGNGTLAFAVTPTLPSTASGALSSARGTLSIEFDTSCSAAWDDNNHGSGRGGWMGGPWRGYDGQLGGFDVTEYAKNVSMSPQEPTWGYGPGWTNYWDHDNGKYFCSLQPEDDTYQFQVLIEYNASTEVLSVASPSCGVDLARVLNFTQQNLPDAITGPSYVGFIVADGAVYNISQWNFTSNPTESLLTSLVSMPAAGSSPDTNAGPGGLSSDDPDSGKKHNKGLVAGLSVLGAAIGAVAVLGVGYLAAQRKRGRTRMAATESGPPTNRTIPNDATIFNVAKFQAPIKIVDHVTEQDTAPLTRSPSYSHATASWLPPVAPR